MKSILTIMMMCSIWLCNAQKVVIQKADLPKAAQEFLNKEYAKTAWAIGKKETKAKKIKYEVTLADGVEIEFKENGEWKEIDGKGHMIPSHLIPMKINEYVMKHYSAEKITKIEKSNKKTEVKLSNGIELKFDLNGNFVKID